MVWFFQIIFLRSCGSVSLPLLLYKPAVGLFRAFDAFALNLQVNEGCLGEEGIGGVSPPIRRGKESESRMTALLMSAKHQVCGSSQNFLAGKTRRKNQFNRPFISPTETRFIRNFSIDIRFPPKSCRRHFRYFSYLMMNRIEVLDGL